MKKRIGLLGATCLLAISTIGCGGRETGNIAENAEADKIAEYERMIAEEEAKANAENGDAN